MEKKTYYELTLPTTEPVAITLELSGALKAIEEEWKYVKDTPEEFEPMQITMTPVQMTEDEFNSLPEYEY